MEQRGENMYNITLLQESYTMFKLVSYVNDITDGAMGTMLIISIFFISLLMLKRYPLENALAASGWICFFLGIFLTSAGLLNYLVTLGFLVISAFSTLYAYKMQN